VSGHAHLVDLVHLEFDEGVDPVIGKDSATGEEVTILVQRFKRFFEAGANGRDLGVFFGGRS
jgi:hypothetical protein